METLPKSELVQIAKTELEKLSKEPCSENFGTGADNARYGGVTPDGQIKLHRYPCHAYMVGMMNPKHLINVAFSQFMHPKKKMLSGKILDCFFDFLVDGPWSKVFDGVDEANPSFNLEWAYENGFIFDNLETVPANYFHNFLVASRMPKEWPQSIQRWYELCNSDIHPAVAMFFSVVFSPFRYKNTGAAQDYEYMNTSNKYDWPFDHATCYEDYILNLIQGKTDFLTDPWMKASQYTPVNRVWGKNDYSPTDPNTYLQQLFERYKSWGFDEKKCKSLGSTLSQWIPFQNFFLSKSDVFKIVKAENDRLMKLLKAE